MNTIKKIRIPFYNFEHFFLEHSAEFQDVLAQTMSSGKYIRSGEVNELEFRIAKFCSRKYSVTTGSCTDALFFALSASGVGKGDEVILTPFSYIATLSAIIRCGATPVFADIRDDNLMLNIDSVEQAITSKTKAIIFVQLFGNCIEYEPFQSLAEKKHIILIEDAAQAIGSSYKNMPGGSFGDISCISFDPTKIISAFATGGVLLTDKHEVYQKALSLSHHGRNTNGQYDTLGYNSKLSAFSSGLINLQLNYINNILKKYYNICERYKNNLNKNNNIKLVCPGKDVSCSYHKFVIRVKERELLKNTLAENGIESNIHYDPLLYEHPVIKKTEFIVKPCPVSIKAQKEVLSLPVHLGLSIQNIDYICEIINQFI